MAAAAAVEAGAAVAGGGGGARACRLAGWRVSARRTCEDESVQHFCIARSTRGLISGTRIADMTRSASCGTV
eukprot:547887-Prymnesium_polylepis.1